MRLIIKKLLAEEKLSKVRTETVKKSPTKKMYLQVTAPIAFIRRHGVDVECALLQVIGIRIILPHSVPLLSAFH